jgi:hypothetical protein
MADRPDTLSSLRFDMATELYRIGEAPSRHRYGLGQNPV